MPVATVRRLACEANIIPAVLNGDGVVLDLGRSRRVANEHQRHALRSMYDTCGHPDCQVRFNDCDIHHVIPWNRAGPTNLDNLLPLCTSHHHAVHEGGWQPHPPRPTTHHPAPPRRTLHFQGSTVNARAG